jgi:hypothetical protein
MKLLAVIHSNLLLASYLMNMYRFWANELVRANEKVAVPHCKAWRFFFVFFFCTRENAIENRTRPSVQK